MGQRCQQRLQRQRSMIVAHRRHGDRVGAVLQHAMACILFDPQLRPCQLLEKTPEFPPSGGIGGWSLRCILWTYPAPAGEADRDIAVAGEFAALARFERGHRVGERV